MKYEFYTPLGTKPGPLKKQLAKFQIDARLKGITLMSNGACAGAPGWLVFTPLTTSVSLACVSAGIAGPAGVVGGVAVGLVLDAMFPKGKKDSPPPPVPVATLIRVEFVDVSPKRIEWAEYNLLGYAQSNGWDLLTEPLFPRNVAYAARGRPAPIPWSESKRKPRAKKSVHSPTYTDQILAWIFRR